MRIVMDDASVQGGIAIVSKPPTCPLGSMTYWVGEAQGEKDYKDLLRTPKAVRETTAMLASNTAHLARLLKKSTYPGMK